MNYARKLAKNFLNLKFNVIKKKLIKSLNKAGALMACALIKFCRFLSLEKYVFCRLKKIYNSRNSPKQGFPHSFSNDIICSIN